MPGRPTALVTGAASGIGHATATCLAENGYNLTVVDVDAEGLHKLATALRSKGASVFAAVVDVRDNAQQADAVRRHIKRFGSLDVAILNAGVGESANFYHFKDTASWERCLDIDLRAVIVGVEECGRAMAAAGTQGTIVSVASAASIYPVPDAPIYAAAKAGVVHFTRSAAGKLAKMGITLCTVCPEYVDTPLVRRLLEANAHSAREAIPNLRHPLLKPQQVVDVVLDCCQGKHQAGSVLLLLQSGRLVLPYAKQAAGPRGSSLAAASPSSFPSPSRSDTAQLAAWAAGSLPKTYRKLIVQKLSNKFEEATQLVEAPLPNPPPPGKVLVRRAYAGINASDINYTSGRYHSSKAEAERQLPFDAGFETVGVVAAVGEGVRGFAVGDSVAAISYGGFAEYALEAPKLLLRVPAPTPQAVALLVSGLTASIALEQCGRLQSGETVLVTAAAGGTGQFAVQLAKAAGCHVIATCSGGAKSVMLRRLGADRVVDYKTESLKEVLKREHPKGVDVVYEGVGGSFFDTAVNALAPNGRLIIIGMVASYQEGWPPSTHPGLAEKLLWKSATVSGFFLLRQMAHAKRHLGLLLGMVAAGKLVVGMDGTRFVGVESVGDAVAYLNAGGSAGKVVVQLARELPPAALARM